MPENKPLTTAEARELLDKEATKRELSFEQKAAQQQAINFTKLNAEKSRKLVGELQKIENISENLAVKIADLMPEHPDDLRAILAKERFGQDQKTFDAILEAVRKYL